MPGWFSRKTERQKEIDVVTSLNLALFNQANAVPRTNIATEMTSINDNIGANLVPICFPFIVGKETGLYVRRYQRFTAYINQWNYEKLIGDPNNNPSVGTRAEMENVPSGHILSFFRRYDNPDEVRPILIHAMVTLGDGIAVGVDNPSLQIDVADKLIIDIPNPPAALVMCNIARIFDTPHGGGASRWRGWGYANPNDNNAQYIHHRSILRLKDVKRPGRRRQVANGAAFNNAPSLPSILNGCWHDPNRPRRFFVQDACERIEATTTWIVKTSEGKFKVWDTDLNIFLTEELEDNPWRNMAKHIGLRIKPRVDADNGDGGVLNTDQDVDAPAISTKKLFDPGYTLKEVKFADADSHGDGEVPAFLIFQNGAGAVKKIVYKPRNLDVDQVLFNTDDSIAKWLSDLTDNNTEISQYTLLSLTDTRGATGNGERYGYMEFVESGVPTTEAELLSVWKSVGANMALSYIVGLEDIHNENFILKKDRIQLIDMEATTGLYKSFDSMLWTMLFNSGTDFSCLKIRLIYAVGAKAYGWLPKSDSALGLVLAKRRAIYEAREGFKDVLGAAKKTGAPGGDAGFDAPFRRAKNALSGMISRLVPVATATFYYTLPGALGTNSIDEWRAEEKLTARAKTWADNSEDQDKIDFMKRILRLESTYEALVNCDIPAFQRHLGSSHIYPENVAVDLTTPATNAIDSTGCNKVGVDIRIEMDKRRAHLINPVTHPFAEKENPPEFPPNTEIPEDTPANRIEREQLRRPFIPSKLKKLLTEQNLTGIDTDDNIEKTAPFKDFWVFGKKLIEDTTTEIVKFNNYPSEKVEKLRRGQEVNADRNEKDREAKQAMNKVMQKEREERIRLLAEAEEN